MASGSQPKGMRFACIHWVIIALPVFPSITTLRMKSPSLLPPLLFLIFCCQPPARAAPLNDAIDSQVKANQAAAASQKNIDGLRDQTQRLLEEYREALRQTEVLQAYNAHLRRMVESQRTEKTSLEQQFKDIEVTRRDLIPLILRMTATLQTFVNLDRPFLIEERTKRVADLEATMKDYEINDAEKFRRLLEVYQLENGYGKTVGAYQGEIELDGKDSRTVDYLRVGRIGFYYQTFDGRESGIWNDKTRRWEGLPSEYNKMIRKGIVQARMERPKDLLSIPIEAPESAR